MNSSCLELTSFFIPRTQFKIRFLVIDKKQKERKRKRKHLQRKFNQKQLFAASSAYGDCVPCPFDN